MKIFAEAIAESKDKNGEIVYIPGIFSMIEKTIVLFAFEGFKTQQDAIETAQMIAHALEIDFIRFLETGKRSYELYIRMREAGIFIDPACSEIISSTPVSSNYIN